MDFLTLTIGKQKNIALIAHDSKKHEMIEWCEANKEILKGHFLCGTGTTARMITEATGLPVKGYNSGPLGGDQQIGAKIVEGRIDFVVFFSDPLSMRRSRTGRRRCKIIDCNQAAQISEKAEKHSMWMFFCFSYLPVFNYT